MNSRSKSHCRPRFAGALSLAVCLCVVLAVGMLAGCSSPAQEEADGQPEPAAGKPLDGKTLDVYCGAGMTDPFRAVP